MDRFVARENIRHFKLLLEQATDPVERQRLLTLLAEEEKKLKEAETQHKKSGDER